MATYSIIQKSQLEGAHRLDAEYFQPEYLRLESLKNFSQDVLKNEARCFAGFAFPSGEFSKNNIMSVIKMTEILGDGFVDLNDAEGISFEFYKKNQTACDKFRAQRGDIVVALTGATIGKSGIVLDQESFVNQRVLLCRAKTISKEYLWTLLSSTFFHNYIMRGALGGAQPNVSPQYAVNFPIPTLDKSDIQKIEQLTKESVINYESSKSLYSQAENLLLEGLGLGDWIPDRVGNDISWTINFSDIKTAGRMDAEYFQPKYQRLESKVKTYESKMLEEIIENVPANFDPAKRPDEWCKYIELSNVNASIGTIEGFSEMLGKEAPSRAKRVLKENDVIVSSVEGSLGKVALVHKDQKDYSASTGFFQFRSKRILPEVLLVLAKSIVFQWQLEKRCAGTILTAVPKESIKDIFVPILPQPIQQKIAELVRQSHESRKKAKELLEQAKREVEELIENQV